MDRRYFYSLLVPCLVVIAAWDGAAAHSPLGRKLAQLPDQLLDPTAAGPWRDFIGLLDLKQGDWDSGLGSLKSYLVQFGYLDPANATTIEFDVALLDAVKLYQQNFRINITGVLDAQTLKQLITPRCGGKDVIGGVNQMVRDLTNSPIPAPVPASVNHLGVSHYSFFPGGPKWSSKSQLTYAFNSSNGTPSLVTEQQRNDIFFRAFSAWSAVVKLNFTRITDYSKADITIAFDAFEHGDGEPFDGNLGVLAHAFSPEDGKFHLDSDEVWLSNVKLSTSPNGIDLQSVVLHEIGHIIGLGHSADPNAIMYPSISPREQKQSLMADDIAGAQALYEPNPNYDPNAPLPTVDPNNNQQSHALGSHTGAMASLLSSLFLVVAAVVM